MSTATGFQGTGGPKENVLQNLFCFEMWRQVAPLVVSNVSEEPAASIFSMKVCFESATRVIEV
jgi:hypothetical protein